MSILIFQEISWDIQRLCHLAYMLPFLEMEEERALLTDVLNHFEAVVIPKLPGLRAQVFRGMRVRIFFLIDFTT